MQDMPTLSVRLTEEEKKELLEYGGLSKGVREGVRLYLKGSEVARNFSQARRPPKGEPR